MASVDDRIQESWRLLVEERIANIGKINLERFDDFLRFSNFFGFWIFANQPTVQSGGVSRGGYVVVNLLAS